MAEPAESRMTLQAFIDMEMSSDVRHEFINGVAYAMAGGSRDHSRIGGNLFRAVANRLEAGGSECIASNSDQRLMVQATGCTFYPDVAVYCDQENDGEDVEALVHPTVLVEVLSPSTGHHDRFIKFNHFMRIPSLQQYILVDSEAQIIECRTRYGDGVWSVHYVTGDSLWIDALEMSLPLEEIYRNTDVPPPPDLKLAP